MRKFLLPVFCTICALGAATFVWASVINSPHDLVEGGEPCAACHTPHNGTGEYPLWNRTQEATSYTPYESFSFDMGPAASDPNYPSKLCLVCHNGIQSELVNYPGPCNLNFNDEYNTFVLGCAELGLDLKNDHPIGFEYVPGVDADPNTFPPAHDVSMGGGARARWQIDGTDGAYYPLYGDLSSGNLGKNFECATCHSVHDTAVYPGKGDYQVYFLRSDNQRSKMCIDCHTLK